MFLDTGSNQGPVKFTSWLITLVIEPDIWETKWHIPRWHEVLSDSENNWVAVAVTYKITSFSTHLVSGRRKKGRWREKKTNSMKSSQEGIEFTFHSCEGGVFIIFLNVLNNWRPIKSTNMADYTYHRTWKMKHQVIQCRK
jgi:hypothetical protein